MKRADFTDIQSAPHLACLEAIHLSLVSGHINVWQQDSATTQRNHRELAQGRKNYFVTVGVSWPPHS